MTLPWKMLNQYVHIKYQSRSTRDLLNFDIYKLIKAREDEELKLSVLQGLKKKKQKLREKCKQLLSKYSLYSLCCGRLGARGTKTRPG